MNSPIVELVLFRLNAGVADASFLEAADATAGALHKLGGFIRRELLKSADGQWVDLVYWNSMAEAQHAADAIMHLPACRPFLGMIDESSITMLHLDRWRKYNEVGAVATPQP